MEIDIIFKDKILYEKVQTWQYYKYVNIIQVESGKIKTFSKCAADTV